MPSKTFKPSKAFQPIKPSNPNRHNPSKAFKPQKRRRATTLFMVVIIVAAASAIALLAVFVFPTQQYFDQRSLITETEQVLERLQQETDQLSHRVDEAQKPTSVERSAREKLSLVREGDTLYQLSVSPGDALRLPDDWPLVGVKHLLGAD